MKADFRLAITLVCVVSFIFVLRDSETSPGGFLKQQIKRVLDDNSVVDKYCSGINLQTTVTKLDTQAGNAVRSSLSKLRNGNPLITFIQGSDSKSDFAKKYAVPALAFGAPWIIFFIITILVCIGFLFNWCCMYCSCCRCCKCCGLPKTRNHARGLAGASAFFGVATIAVAIAGIVVSRGVATGGNATLCAGISLLAKLVQGDESMEWVGVLPLATKLYTVLASYDITMNQLRAAYPLNNVAVPALLAGTSTGAFTTDYVTSLTDGGYNTAVTSLQNMYNSNKGKTVSRSDPNSGSSTYTPDYIANLGPDTNSTTNTGEIEAELFDKKNRTKNAATSTDSSMSILFAAQLVFRNGLQDAKESAFNTSISVGKLYDNIGNFADKAQTAFNALGGGLLGLFVLEGVLALFALLSICLVCRGARSFNKGVHISWCCISLLSLLTWILATVSLPASLILFEVCDASNLFINDAKFFNQTFDKFLPAEDTSNPALLTSANGITGVGTITSGSSSSSSSSDSDNNKTITKARNILYNCLFAEQDMLKILNVSDTLGYFNNLMEPADDVSDLTGTISPNSVEIPLQQFEIASYKVGYVPDASQATTDLNTLNQYTNKATTSCTDMQDIWVLNSANCSSGTVFPAGGADTFNVGNPTCIGLDVWTTQDITNRYKSANYPSSCPAVGTRDMLTYVQTFVNNFVSSRSSAQSVFNDVNNSLNTVSSNNDALMSDILQATQNYPKLKNITATWHTAITDKNQGVYHNSKCTFVRSSVQTVHDVMCSAFVVNLFQSAVAIIIISFMSFFGFIMLFCLAKRFVVPQKKEAAKGENYKY